MRNQLFAFLVVVICTSVFLVGSQAAAVPCAGTVTVQVIEDTIKVRHDDALLTCGAQVQFQLTQIQDTLNLYENGTCRNNNCFFCTCSFDLIAEIPNVAPGHYLVRLLTAWYGQLIGVCSEVWVDVEGSGQGNPRLGEALQSPCGGWTVGIDKGTASTWGRIKAVYR
jgi:hypothetical protein